MRILKENCLGLVIDLQEKLFPVMADKERLLVQCQRLLQGLGHLAIPVLVTQQYSKGLGETLPELQSLFTTFEVIEKGSFSCLDEPIFASQLVNSGKNVVLICGIESHVCVLQTAIDLQEKGYTPVVLADCVSSRNPEEKEIALQRFATEGIRISSVESILFELTRSSAAAEFRAISKLIK